MITIMSTAPGASVAPYQGQGLSGSLVKPHSVAAQKFLNVIRDMLRVLQVYHNEADLNAAYEAIDAYGKQIIDPADRLAIVSESDTAPREDVSKRVPANIGQNATAPMAGYGPIDYNKLAAALVLAQQQLNSAPAQVHTITDLPEQPTEAAASEIPPLN